MAAKKGRRPQLPPPCDHVAIVALGPSVSQYLDLTKRLGNRRALADQTWAINSLGDVFQCDLVFHMDDVRVQEIRAEAQPQGNIAAMVRWLKTHDGPVMTSQAVPGYPCLVEFPLERALREFGTAYYNSTVAYAVAYAILIGVKRLSLFGIDYTYPNAHQAEKGRACVEYWLGRAHERGMELRLAQETTLLDTVEHGGSGVLYGYDAVHVDVEPGGKVKFSEKPLPTAAEIEAAYDHSKHPNALVEEMKP